MILIKSIADYITKNMGNDVSSPEDDYPDEYAKFDGIETLGYRVLGVQPNSPAAQAGLVSFLDFLVGCNGEMLMGSGDGLEEGDEYNDIDFPSLLKDNVGKELELCKLLTYRSLSTLLNLIYESHVYTSFHTICCNLIVVHNIKSNSQRLVKITPTNDWGGAGLLGVTIRLDNYGGADERLIRVLSVEHNSPAAIAGLVPMKDYLLGTTSTSFDTDAILAEVLMVHADRIVELYVYSSESDVVRVVTLMPTLTWGGRGLLGAEVGTGYLHMFPKECRGTDGASIERKIRMGVRPTPPTEALAKSNIKDEEGENSEDMVNLTELQDTLSGKQMCFQEELEMEPEPEEMSEQTSGQEPSQSSAETNNTNEHSSPTSKEEANALFDGPPPSDVDLR